MSVPPGGLPDLKAKKPLDLCDRIDERVDRASGEQEADRSFPIIDHEGPAVPSLGEHVADELVPEDRDAAVVVDLDDRVEPRDRPRGEAGRPTALPHGNSEVRDRRPVDLSDVEDLRRDEV